MQPLAKSSGETSNTTESLTNVPAYKCGWLYKRGKFYDQFFVKTCPDEINLIEIVFC